MIENLKISYPLTFVNKTAVCAHNNPKIPCQFKKTPYLCIVKRNKALATQDNIIN